MMNSVQTPSTVVVPTERKCPRCGATLGGFGPEGLCGPCMFGAAIESDDAPPVPDLLAPGARRFGDYEILEEIARGGMGVVFKARQVSLNRIVAVKMILRGEFAGVAELARFRAEAETAARLQHPNIVAIHEVGEHEGQPFFSMDFVDGQSLAQLVGNIPLPATRAAKYLKTIAEAVQHAHEHGVLHRDLKPSNVLIDTKDQPRVTDFGLAKRLEGDASLTVTGQVLGSPSFMPPEQAAGKSDAIGPASDAYSLGAVLYHMLTGRPPFAADSVPATLRLVTEAEPVAPTLLVPGTPRDLETICLKCLEKDSRRRYATAQELAEELNRFLRDEPILARPVSPGEKFWRWCRRNPAFATSGAVVLLLLLTVAIGSPIAGLRIKRERERAETNAWREAQQRILAETNAFKAEELAKLETMQRTRAETLAEENRLGLYSARLALSDRAFHDGNAAHAMELLNSLRPKPGQTDLRSFDWYYLWQLCRSERYTLQSGGRLFGTAFSPDGRWLATAGSERSIRLYEAATGIERASCLGHTNRVTALAFAPDGTTLASGSTDSTVRLWDAVTGKELRKLELSSNGRVAVAFSPDGSLVATGEGATDGSGNPTTRFQTQTGSGTVTLWNPWERRVERTIAAHRFGIQALVFSPDGRSLFTCGGDRAIRRFEVATGRVLAAYTNSALQVFDLAVSVGGEELAVASWFPYSDDSGEIKILDAVTLAERRVLTTDAGKILCLAASPDGSKLASAGADRIARVWDWSTGEEVSRFSGHSKEIVSLAFGAGGATLATAGWDEIVKVWDVEGSPVRQRIPTPQCFSVAFSPDGTNLACGGVMVEVRSASDGKLIRSLTEYTNYDIRVAYAPDGSVLAAVGYDRIAHFWDTTAWRHWNAVFDGSQVTNAGNFIGKDCSIAFSPDSQTLALPGRGKSVCFFDVRSGRQTGVIADCPDTVHALAYTPDGRTLVAADGSRIGFWDIESRSWQRSIRRTGGIMVMSKDGQWMASRTDKPGLTLEEPSSMKFLARFVGHKDVVWGMAFSPDSRLFGTASWDGTVKLWHLASGQELLTIPSQSGVVWSVAFSPDSRTLAFGSGSTAKGIGMVTVLRAASDAQVNSKSGPTRPPPPSAQELIGKIPPRSAECPSNLLDLSAWFNSPLTNSWVNTRYSENHLASLPTGVQTFDGMAFDIRGIVQLDSASPDIPYAYAASQEGLRVGRRCVALHFLHATSWLRKKGTNIGEYVIHYADGGQEVVPILYGENTTHWWSAPSDRLILSPTTKAAWRGKNPASKRFQKETRLYDFRWLNSRPEVEIRSIDFKSAMTLSAPFLLAITAE